MSQRNSGYARVESNFYPTPAWVTRALIEHVLGENNCDYLSVWEPACGDGAMVDELKAWGFKTYGTDIRESGVAGRDFLDSSTKLLRPSINAIITNPPYGRGLSDAFITKSLELMEPCKGLVAMLLRIDFDSAVTRRHLFADHPAWETKLVLTKRIKWFDDGNKNGPSENHAWYVWNWKYATAPARLGPRIVYGQ